MNKTLKILTLFSFTILLAGFVAFKCGMFDRYFTNETEAPKKVKKESETPTIKEERTDFVSISEGEMPGKEMKSVKPSREMMYTSKSVILIDQTIDIPETVLLKEYKPKKTQK